jgi:hypothetical protein
MAYDTKVLTVGGPNTLTWNSTSIGLVEDNITINIENSFDNIKTNDLGDGIVDSVYRGQNVTVTARFQEYSKIKPALIAAAGTEGNGFVNVGKLMSGLAKALIITPKINGGAIYTFTTAYIENTYEINLGAHLQAIDVVFRILPDPTTGLLYTIS